MIVKFARYEVRIEAVPQALAAVRAFVDEVRRKEGGTARYEVYQEKAEPTRFTHLMSFRTPSAEQYHQKTAWAKRFSDAIAPLATQPIAYVEVVPLEP